METMVVVPSGRLVDACCCCCCTSLFPVFSVWLWNGAAGEATGTNWGHWDICAPDGTSWETGMPWMEGTTCGREKTCGEELLEEMTELCGFNWEPAVAKTTYSTCGLERDMAELDVTRPVEDMEDERLRGSCVFCVKTSEGIVFGQDILGDEEDKEEEDDDTVWLLPSLSGTLMKSIALLLSVFACRELEMMDGGLDAGVVLVLRTTAGRLPALFSRDATSRCGCKLTLDLVITWAPFTNKGELVATGLSVTV